VLAKRPLRVFYEQATYCFSSDKPPFGPASPESHKINKTNTWYGEYMKNETFHNPDQHMSALRTIIAGGRKRIGLLL